MSIATPSESNLTSTLLDQDQRVLLLTAANSGSGTSTAALAVASQLAAMSGGAVLLIDGSNACSNLSQQLGLNKLRGLRDLLFDDQTPPLAQDCIVRLSDQRFDVLPCGLHERSGERLDPELLRGLLHRMATDYRFVVIDGDAIYAGADSLVMSPLVDGVILVINANDTRREVAQAASQRLSLAGARLVGSVFNRRRYYMPTWLYNHL